MCSVFCRRASFLVLKESTSQFPYQDPPDPKTNVDRLGKLVLEKVRICRFEKGKLTE